MLKETLERFDKNRKEKWHYLEVGNETTEAIKQFIVEEIKLAMEKIVPKKYVSKAKFVDVILYGEPAGYNKAIKKINSNISKYFE